MATTEQRGRGRGRAWLALLAAACTTPDAPPPGDVLTLPPFDGTAFACQDGGVDPAGCADLARAYADVQPIGLRCDPDALELCNSPRPSLSSSAGDGGAPDGVCSCPLYVSPPQSGALDAALYRYLQAGCRVRCCPCAAQGTAAVHPCRALAPGNGTCG